MNKHLYLCHPLVLSSPTLMMHGHMNLKCSQILDQNKQAKMQWLQDPKQSNLDNLKHLRHDTSRHFRNKMKEYLKVKIDELEKYQTCIGASVTLRSITILELIQ